MTRLWLVLGGSLGAIWLGARARTAERFEVRERGITLATMRGSQPRTVWDSVYTGEQATRGAALYRENCARCHQDALTGADASPPLAGATFLSTWGGLTVADLHERVRTSMPSDKPGSLNRQQVSDVLAHVLRVNGFPAGNTELPRAAELLKEIRIEATRP
jgi:cytochrome c